METRSAKRQEQQDKVPDKIIDELHTDSLSSTESESENTPPLPSTPLPTEDAAPADNADIRTTPTDDGKPAIQAFNPTCLNSNQELNDELNRLHDAFERNISLSPYPGNIHQKKHALSRELDRYIADSCVSDKRKLELYDTALEHKVFGHRKFALLKEGLTSAVRMFKPGAHPAPSRSQQPLIAGRDALTSKMDAECANMVKPTK